MILAYFNGGIERSEALCYAAIISICAVIGGVLHHPYYFNSWRIGMKIRIGCSGLMYRKVSICFEKKCQFMNQFLELTQIFKIFRLSINTLDSNASGDIINLLSTDATRIEIGVLYLPYLIIGPIQILVVVAVIMWKIGVYFLVGLLLLLLIIPLQALIAKAYNNYRFLLIKICYVNLI